MDRHKQRLIDSAVKILDDNAIIIKNVNEQAHIDITRYKFVKSLIEQIDYVMNSLLFQPDKNIIFDCIIKYLDEFIKQFDTLYSPSHSQRYQFSNLQDPMHLPPGMRYFDDPSELTYIFDKTIKFEQMASKIYNGVMYEVVFDIRQRFNGPFKNIIHGGYPNLLGWIKSSKPCTFIKIYMTAVRDFFVSVRPTSSSKDKSEIDEFFKGLGKGPKTFKKKKRGTK